MDYEFQMNCGMLKQFDQFDKRCDNAVPAFSYTGSHPGLQKLREKYEERKPTSSGESTGR